MGCGLVDGVVVCIVVVMILVRAWLVGHTFSQCPPACFLPTSAMMGLACARSVLGCGFCSHGSNVCIEWCAHSLTKECARVISACEGYIAAGPSAGDVYGW